MQLVSSGNDGLVKVWTIRTNECVTTLDSHEDKVGKGRGGARGGAGEGQGRGRGRERGGAWEGKEEG